MIGPWSPALCDTLTQIDWQRCRFLLQGQHRRILELERASMETLQRLRASEQGRLKAEARTAELQQELENNAGGLAKPFLLLLQHFEM